MDGEWKTVVRKRAPVKHPSFKKRTEKISSYIPKNANTLTEDIIIDKEEEKKFAALQSEIPHLILPDKIRRLAKEMNIDLLAEKILSDDWVTHQRNGWVYLRVIKPDDIQVIPIDTDHSILPLDNGWGDVVLFQKLSSKISQ
jgi:hypothetical protein